MPRILTHRDHHGRIAHLPVSAGQGRTWFNNAFPELDAHRNFNTDSQGNLLRYSVAGSTQIAQRQLTQVTTASSALIEAIYTRFYGERFTLLPASVREDATVDAFHNAQILFCKCLGWHEDTGCDFNDHRLLYVLSASEKAWQLQLASLQATNGWRQRGSPYEPSHIKQHLQHDLQRGDIIGFDQSCLHRIIAHRPASPWQRPLLVLNLTAIFFEQGGVQRRNKKSSL